MVDTIPPIKIVLISHCFEQNDGQGRVNYEIALSALARGYHVTVLATRCAKEISGHKNTTFVPTGNMRIPSELLRNQVFAFSSARWLRKHRDECDLVFANGFITWEDSDVVAAHFVHTAWRQSKYNPFVTMAPYSLYRRAFTWLNSRWEKRAFDRAKVVIAVSGSVRNELESLGIPRQGIQVILNGVDTDQFAPGPCERASFGLPVNTIMALFVGDIRTSRKNLETVLRALTSVPDMHLVVAGATAGSPSLLLAKKLGVSDRVHFLGKIDRIPELMRSADLFVFPTRYEAHPLVVMEAMASGLPMIVSDTFGATDFVGTSAEILSDPDDVEALAGFMTALSGDAISRARMGAEGRQLALKMQWSATTDTYLQVFGSMLKQAGRQCESL